MALYTFFLNPSADIHLVLNPVTHQKIQLDVIGFDDTSGHIGSIRDNCRFKIVNRQIAYVSLSGLLTAKGRGITFLTVTHIGTNLELVARIWVHNSIVKFYQGNNTATVNKGTDNLQLTMFAEFSDGDLEDVTGHPYFFFHSAAPTIAKVDTTSGRVEGINTGNTIITILENINTTNVGTVPLTVKEALNNPRPIVERVSFKGYGAEKKNILFLAEGFTIADKEKFKEIVINIDRRMRNSDLHEPYKLLSNDYNTWMAFEPSAESGITIGPFLSLKLNPIANIRDFSPDYDNVTMAIPNSLTINQLIDLVGPPTREQKDATTFTRADAGALWGNLIPGFNANSLEVFPEWQLALNEGRLKPRNTALGLINGLRIGDRYARPTNPDKPDNSWYRSLKSAANFFYMDSRRVSSGKLSVNAISDSDRFFYNSPLLPDLMVADYFTYLDSLREVSPTLPGFNIGNKWNLHGDDQGLVMIISNSEYHIANYFNFPSIFGALSIGYNNGIDLQNLTYVTNSLMDYNAPNLNVSGKFMEAITATFVHELSHAINLGDEYEGKEALSLKPEEIEVYHNLNTIQRINSEGTKWEFSYFRMSKSSALIKDSVITVPNTLELELFPGEGSKWRENDTAILVTKNINSVAYYKYYYKSSSHPVLITGDLTVTSKAGDKITVSGPTISNTFLFPKGSLLCVRKSFNSDILKIHLPGSLAFMNGGLGRFPTGKNLHKIDPTNMFSSKAGNCSVESTDLAKTPHPIPKIDISKEKKHWLLGLHEGGGTYNCGVVRAAAVCKMRSTYNKSPKGKGHFRFCHLCKYIIVQEFNPSKHSRLESQYPGSPSLI